MSSHKSIPMKKHENHVSHEHHTSHEHRPKDNGSWMFLSVVLGVLLVVSVFTNGFRFNSLQTAQSSLNSMLKQNIPTEAKDSVSQALTSLGNAKTAIDATKQAAKTDYKGQIVKLDFYVMSQCPYGIQVENGVKPALDKLGDAVDFSVNFIASDNGDGTFQSLHGQNEVLGNIVQLCAMKYNPDNWMDMVVCMNQNSGNIPGNWEQCAKDNNLDANKIKTCYEGNEGKALHSESIKRSNAVNARGSPTMFINDQPYNGGRDALSFTKALCAQIPGHPECAKMPVCSADTDCTGQSDKIGKCENPNTDKAKCNYVDPSPVNMIVINDKKCADCQQANGIVDQLKTMFKGLNVKYYDYEDAEGKKIYDENSLTILPAFLFDETVQGGEGYANIQNYLVPQGKYTSLRIGASFNPKSEICDNKVDDRDNDGKIDCADDECQGNVLCRPEAKNNLKVFIMSDCPYGKEAIKAAKELRTNFGDRMTFEVHYIASDNGDGTFSSLHGAYEAEEDIRQLCVEKYSPSQWFDYIYCRSVGGIKGVDWKTCAQSSGVDQAKVESCTTGEEGKALLREDIKNADELGISASPTWLANNKYQFGGIAAEPVKASFCQYNTGLAGCENTLSGASAGGAAPSGAACG